MNELAEQALQMRTLMRQLREQRSPAACADALCRCLQSFAAVRQAWYLGWQPEARIYAALGAAEALPLGSGDPLQASDQALFEVLQGQPSLSLAELRRLPCWLAGRLRRGDITHGQALALALLPEQPGVLLVQLREGQALDWLEPIHALLAALLPQPPEAAHGSPLLDADPQPGLLIDADGQPLDCNAALRALLGEPSLNTLAQHLPVNHRQLVRACLAQRRAIEPVQVQLGAKTLIWGYVPDVGSQRVLARCREASAEMLANREAAKARRLYRLITENTTDLISRHLPDGRYLDASPASWTLLGHWPEALRGRPVLELFHPQDIGLLQRCRDALEQDGYHTMTFRIRHRDGHYLWFETASRAIRETYTGAVVEVVSVSRDITARVRAEEKKRRLAEVVEVNTDLVLFLSADGRITYLNPAARHALQVPEGSAAPQLAQLFADADLRRLHEEGRPAAERCGVWSSEARLQPCGDAPSFPVSLVLLAHAGEGERRDYSLVARDMTERELRESQQRHHQDELAHTARLVTLGELASGIAHEINQPLAAVVNYAGASQRYLQALARNPQAAQRVAEGLQRITEHANHAAQVIKRLRAFLRKGQRRMQALQLAQVAREAVRLCAWEAAGSQVLIEDRLSDELPHVYADPVLLEQVLLNLLRNAIDANREAHPGGASRILLHAHREEDGVAISVSDQGPGASDEALARMFTPFYTSKPDGLGLGLSMSRSIVEGFGGSLEAEPGEGGGLRLVCRLPLRVPPALPEDQSATTWSQG